MYRVDARKPVHFCDGLTRRDFLHAGAFSTLGLGLPAFQALKAQGAVAGDRDVNCILLFLVGPAQLDTWDMKPDAPGRFAGRSSPSRPRRRASQVARSSRGWPRHGQGFAGPDRLLPRRRRSTTPATR